MNLRYAFLIILFTSTAAWSQVPGVEWEQAIAHAQVRSATASGNNSFAVAFDSKSCTDSTAMGIAAFDSDGIQQWQQVFIPSSGARYHAFSLQSTADGGYLLAGSKDSMQVNFNLLMKCDNAGNILWQRQFYFNDSVQTFFGKAIEAIGGTVFYAYDSYSANLRDVTVMKLNAQGTTIWTRTYGGSQYDNVHDLIATTDGGLLAAASTNSSDLDVTGNHGEKDIWLLKLDTTGNLLWKKCYGGKSNEEVVSVVNTTGGFAVAGISQSKDNDVPAHNGESSTYDAWVFVIDNAGNISGFNKTYGGDQDDFARQLLPAGATTFVLSCSSYSNNKDVTDHHGTIEYDDQWTLQLDNSGSIVWSKSTGGNGDDWSNCLAVLDSSQFVIGGGAVSNGGDHHTMSFSNDCKPIEGGWMVKLNTACPTFATPVFTYSHAGKSFSFSNQSYNALTYKWYFGDGDSSSAVAPVHLYALSGNYQVCLTAFNGCSSQTLCKTVQTCDSVAATFSILSQSGLEATFNITSSGAAESHWDFGDGGTEDNMQTPSHTYSQNGSYVVTLTITDSCNNLSSDTLVVNTCNGFTADFNYTALALTYTFTDATAGPASGYHWDFGDGNTSTLQNPQHTYSNSGTYNVCLTVSSNSCDTQTICKPVTTCSLVVPGMFSFAPLNYQVSFFDSSQYATAWQWDFGDGAFSADQNPVHSYVTGGYYTVCEIMSNACNSDTICQDIFIECNPLESAFSYSANNLTVDFTDLSSGATLWKWSFGDGSTLLLQNPSHTYADTGTYTVCLVVFNPCGSDTSCIDIHVSCAPVVSAYTYSANVLEVDFSSQSSGADSWYWNFGDGDFSTTQNPSHNYLTPGTYTVCLLAYNDCFGDTACEPITVSCQNPTAAFSYSASYLDLTCTDLSYNATSWSWDFGDGATSSLQNPTHHYTVSGTYDVCLVAMNGCANDTLCQQAVIECPPFSAGFTVTQSNDTAWFADASVNSIAWHWAFGDGSGSSQQNPTHVYDTTGLFIACLIAFDGCSYDSVCDSVAVYPLAAPTLNYDGMQCFISPNPVHDVSTIFLSTPVATQCSISLLNVQGTSVRVIFEGALPAGESAIPLVLDRLPAATYLLRITCPRLTAVKKVVVQ